MLILRVIIIMSFFFSTNTAADDDYTPSPVVLVFFIDEAITDNPATSSSRCFNVEIIDDDDIEGNENFVLGLASPTDLIVIQPDSQAIVTITDNDSKLHMVAALLPDKDILRSLSVLKLISEHA